MILNHQGENYPETIITIDTKNISNVNDFVYLGTLITFSNPGVPDEEINRRIGMALGKFSQIKKLLCNYHIHL